MECLNPAPSIHFGQHQIAKVASIKQTPPNLLVVNHCILFFFDETLDEKIKDVMLHYVHIEGKCFKVYNILKGKGRISEELALNASGFFSPDQPISYIPSTNYTMQMISSYFVQSNRLHKSIKEDLSFF